MHVQKNSQVDTAARTILRQDPRVETNLSVVCRTSGAIIRGRVGNVSYRGMFVATGQVPTLGTTVVFAIDTEAGAICGRGVVRWTRPGAPGRPPSGFGVQFNDLDAVSREHLWRLVDGLLDEAEEAAGMSSPSSRDATPVRLPQPAVDQEDEPQVRHWLFQRSTAAALLLLGTGLGWLLHDILGS